VARGGEGEVEPGGGKQRRAAHVQDSPWRSNYLEEIGQLPGKARCGGVRCGAARRAAPRRRGPLRPAPPRHAPPRPAEGCLIRRDADTAENDAAVPERSDTRADCGVARTTIRLLKVKRNCHFWGRGKTQGHAGVSIEFNFQEFARITLK